MGNQRKRIATDIGLALLMGGLLLQPATAWSGADQARALQEQALEQLRNSLSDHPDPAVQSLIDDLERRLGLSDTKTPPTGKVLVHTYVEWLLDNIPPVSSDGRIGLEIDRDYRIEPRGNGFHLQLQPAILHSGDNRIRLGPLQIQADPLGNGRLRVSIDIGQTAPVTRGTRQVAEIRIGGQRFESVWDSQIEGYTRIDWTLTKIQIRDLLDKSVARLNEMTLSGATDYQAGGPWNEEIGLQFRGLRIDAPPDDPEKANVRLDGMRLNASLWGHDLAGFNRTSRRFVRLSEQDSDIDQAKGDRQLIEQLSRLLHYVEGYDFAIEFDGLDTSTPDSGRAHIGRLRVAQGADIPSGKPGHLRLELAVDELDAEQAVSTPPELIPRGIHLDLELAGLPEDTGQWLLDLALLDGGAAGQGAPAQQRLLNRLMQDGVRLIAHDTRVQFPQALLKLDLDARIDRSALFGYRGEMNLEATNLDQLAHAARTQGKAPSTEQMLALFAALAERQQKGRQVVDRLHARLDANGRIWVNGKDVTALFRPEK